MLIDDGTLGLFPFEPDDSKVYRQWVNDEGFARLLGRAKPVTQSQHETWYEGLVSSTSTVVFAVRHLASGAYLGNVWLHGIHWVNRTAELRILLGDQEPREKGQGTRACALLLRFGFEKLGLHKVYLYVSSGNPRARRAFEQAGFRDEGTLKEEFFVDGEFLDVYRMAAFRSNAV